MQRRSPSAGHPRTRCAASARGARPTTSTPGSAKRRCSGSRRRSRSSDRGTRPFEPPPLSALRRKSCRRRLTTCGRVAHRRSFSAASCIASTRPSSLRGSRSVCERACSSGASASMSGPRSGGCLGTGASRRVRVAYVRAPPCWRSTRLRRDFPATGSHSRSPRATSFSPSRSRTCSTSSAGRAARRSSTAARSCTTCERRETGGSRSDGAAARWGSRGASPTGWSSTATSSPQRARALCASSRRRAAAM